LKQITFLNFIKTLNLEYFYKHSISFHKTLELRFILIHEGKLVEYLEDYFYLKFSKKNLLFKI